MSSICPPPGILGKASIGSKLLVGFVSISMFHTTLTIPNPCDSDTQLPFHLVVETPDEKMRYTPKSDFHMCIKDFPHFLLKVNSQSNEGDHVRMLLQAACISRIGNWLRASAPGKPIVIMAIYIDKDFKAHQHFLYQPDEGSTEVMFNWLTGSLWLTQYFLRLNTLPTFSI
jgi:hypothetical protein